ncbi:DUF1376 domain-containing protein [Acinetobacter baumannii]|nr:DUF1376 domain-containing protein [Acinetobacter baumannii]
MHYYERNIGDYYRKAGRLNILQHGVYNLLMDACYDRESFPTLEEAIEWVWAETEEEIDAVKFVLKKFFKLNEDGVYVQTHIEEELCRYREYCAKQSENGKKGGRPKKASSSDESGKNGFKNQSQENPSETQINPEKPKETQIKPKPSNHLTNEPSNQENNICPPNGEPVPAEKPKENFKDEIQEVFDFWKVTFNKNDRTVLSVDRKNKIKARFKEKYTVQDLKQAVIGCSKSSFHVEKSFTDIELICRSAKHVDQFLDIANSSQASNENVQQGETAPPTQYKVIEGRW